MKRGIMHIRRVSVVALVGLLVVSSAGALAQNADKKEPEKRTKQQQEDINNLVQLVDKVSASDPVTATGGGADQLQGEVDIKWQSNHFLKGQDGSTYVPFTVTVERPALTTPNVALYVRAVNKQAAPAAENKGGKD